ncbi:MAG: hypothetical protein ABIQ06_06250 [Caldimonas sp.]
MTDIPRTVSHAEFVEAFYTSALFKLERFVLRVFLSRPSTDLQAARLARGELDAFAAWSVEGRAANQLLLADVAGRTRSWLMVAPSGSADSAGTRLYFGSAVVPRRSTRSGRAGLGMVFSALLGFHKLYSRLLLQAARSRLSRHPAGPPADRGSED